MKNFFFLLTPDKIKSFTNRFCCNRVSLVNWLNQRHARRKTFIEFSISARWTICEENFPGCAFNSTLENSTLRERRKSQTSLGNFLSFSGAEFGLGKLRCWIDEAHKSSALPRKAKELKWHEIFVAKRKSKFMSMPLWIWSCHARERVCQVALFMLFPRGSSNGTNFCHSLFQISFH